MHITTNFLLLDARGTIIKIPYELAKKSPILNNYMENEWNDNNEPYYLNYSKESVHTFLDYLSGENITDYKCYRIYNELMLGDEMNILFDGKEMMTFNDISKAINDINKFYGRTDNIIIDKDQQVRFIECLTYLSYSKGYHLYSHKFEDYKDYIDFNIGGMSIKEFNRRLAGAVFTYDKKCWFTYQLLGNDMKCYKYDKYDTILISVCSNDVPIKRIKHIHEKK